MAVKAKRFTKILCPVDFSPPSLRAFNLALDHASQEGSRIHVLHVIPRIVATLMDIPITTTKWTASQEEFARRELLKLKKRALERGISVKTEIRVGDIDFQILKSANEGPFDLVAMGTHGRRGFERWALGSVAERVLRYSKIPMLFAASAGKSAVPRTMRKILVPCDFSAGMSDAIGISLQIAARNKAMVQLIHIIPDRSSSVEWRTFPDQAAAIHRMLTESVPSQARRVTKVETRIESGEPYYELLRAVESWKPSLVILNMHGHNFVHRILSGSTTERLVRGGIAFCPMLVIPPRQGR